MKITINHKDTSFELQHEDRKYTIDIVTLVKESLSEFSKTFNTKEK